MTPTMPAPARDIPADCPTCRGNGMIGGPSFYEPDEGGVPCPDCNLPELPTCAKSQTQGVAFNTTPARESDDVLERRALAMLTDDQAMASFIRWRTEAHGDVQCVSMRDQLGVSEYVDAIFNRVPHD